MNLFSHKISTKTISAIAFGAIAAFSATNPAQAFDFKMTGGIKGSNGELNQGAFSEFRDLAGTTTVDFNNGQIPSGSSAFASYSFSNGGSNSSVRADMWAPTYATLADGSSNVLKANKNDSKYLAVFSGNNVIINLKENLNYFGINWGAAHSGNTYSFYKGNSLLKAFSTADIDAAGGFQHYNTAHGGGGAGAKGGAQGNGFAHFYAENESEVFDRIVISQVGGGGFETDNHSFHVGSDRFTGFDPQSVPEPGMLLGLASIVGGTLLKRKQQA